MLDVLPAISGAVAVAVKPHQDGCCKVCNGLLLFCLAPLQSAFDLGVDRVGQFVKPDIGIVCSDADLEAVHSGVPKLIGGQGYPRKVDPHFLSNLGQGGHFLGQVIKGGQLLSLSMLQGVNCHPLEILSADHFLPILKNELPVFLEEGRAGHSDICCACALLYRPTDCQPLLVSPAVQGPALQVRPNDVAEAPVGHRAIIIGIAGDAGNLDDF